MLSDRFGPVLAVCPVRNVGVLWPNGWTDQDEKRIKMKLGMLVGLGPGHIVRSPKGAQPPNFRLTSVGSICLDGSRCHLVGR